METTAAPTAPDIVLVRNRTARVLGPSYSAPGGVGAIVRLLPGVNKVPGKTWAKVANDSFVKEHQESGDIEVLDGSVVELPKMTVTRAVDLIRGTYDKAMLRTWLKEDNRKPVIDAIDAQLQLLDSSKADSDDQSGMAATSPLGPAGGVDVSRPRGRRR
jgi:hypothetical protein